MLNPPLPMFRGAAPALEAAAEGLRPLARPCLLLATVPAVGLMACTASPSLVRGINPASADVLLALIALPLWLCLLLAFGALMVAGRLDRWLGPRALQAPAILLAVTALSWLSTRAATLQQPGLAWLAFALPLLALGTGWALAWPLPGAVQSGGRGTRLHRGGCALVTGPPLSTVPRPALHRSARGCAPHGCAG